MASEEKTAMDLTNPIVLVLLAMCAFFTARFVIWCVKTNFRTVAIAIAVLAAITAWMYSRGLGPSQNVIGLSLYTGVMSLFGVAVARPQKKAQYCGDMAKALSDSDRTILAYQHFLDGKMSWKDLTSNMTQLGNAWSGVTPEGMKLAPPVRDAIAEVEQFDFGEEGAQMLKAAWTLISGDDVALQQAKAGWEIQRQKHFQEVIRRKQGECGCK
ncbi:MAG: hypothetical protein QM820_34350 [Minicystis sp.]